jgi:Tfp pilus assembly protein PilF
MPTDRFDITFSSHHAVVLWYYFVVSSRAVLVRAMPMTEDRFDGEDRGMHELIKRGPGSNRIHPAFLIVASGLMAFAPGESLAQQPVGNDWIGKRVVPKYRGFMLKIENQLIDPKTIEFYRVEQVNGPWLWLYATQLNGWALADQVVPVEQAIEFFTEYIRSNPGDAHGYTTRAKIWREERKELDIALGDYNEAIRLDPTSAYVYSNRGTAWNDKKEYDKAIADYNEAIRLDPKDAAPYNGRAWLWATWPDAKYRDGNKAVQSATTACELSVWKDTNDLGTLAASYAEAGDFDSAVKWQSKAIELLSDEKTKEDYPSQLKLHQEKKPYRETNP